ncbi:L-seryl-tRNA(Sec) selenium transferase [Hydrogenobacter hydrogenophilus]|uniref:L-seryl-tRNA(Sec) selenium transferase n=1 Tax=Hydrogenobacter hydrogenophilus TaxID=35835 RepID=A0A285P035_9AQUI|nr:L-seryl-tRNA(Sec) selenium transferase [Hydrogenobacter hydrogenophilus]SNZ14637.1 L-seryl-tRNA(Sec) selenium transferase [Hydrogenobacter hydrogenophilus]
MREELLRSLPQVSKLIEHYKDRYPEVYVKQAVKDTLDQIRKEIKEGKRSTLTDLYEFLEESVRKKAQTKLRRVINATGVVINTNLGRSPLAEEVAEFVSYIAKGYSNLEYDLDEGRRGSRYKLVEEYLIQLTGCESAFVVNNNASAVFLVLNTHASGKEVIVSRGELVEIGGSFRIPDIMRASGARLIEVGTTNKTRLKDYEIAITENTALIMKVHRSNFYMEGFVEDVKVEDLLKLSLPVYYDTGSGLLLDLKTLGINSEEPDLKSCVEKGIHLISASGDKLLGGPQAGIILGKKHLVEPIKRNPLSRIVRIDKMTLAGLEMTLRLYMEERWQEIPILRMLSYKPSYLRRRAKKLYNLIKEKVPELELGIVKDTSKCGGGSLPELTLQTYCVSIKHEKLSAQELSRRLRNLDTPLIGRIKENTLLLDVRTILDEELKLIPDIIRKALL